MSIGTQVECGATDCIYNFDYQCMREEISLFMVEDIYKGCDCYETEEVEE